MTMHIYFKQDKDGYKDGQSCYVERSLARRFCENGIAVPYQTHLDEVYEAEQAAKVEPEVPEVPEEEEPEVEVPAITPKRNTKRR